MKQLKVALPDDLRARVEAASTKSGRSLADEIRVRIEQSFAQEAVDKPTRDFLEGVALMPAEIELETGAAWHKHAGAYEAFEQAINTRLEAVKPEGSTAFGDRPHATVPGDDPILLGAMIEFRLRRQPDFTNSPTRRWLEEEYQRLRADLHKRGTKLRRKHLAQAFLARPLGEQQKPDQQRKREKKS